MNLDWILSPLAAYAVVALTLAATIACFLSAKSEVHRLRRAADYSRQTLESKIEAVETVIAGLGRDRAAAEPASAPVPSVRPSLKLTRRTQALRMRRRGESVESIAAALAAPRNEIELLLKVHEMVEYRRRLPAAAEPVIPA